MMVTTIQEVDILNAYIHGRQTNNVNFKTPPIPEGEKTVEISFTGFDNWEDAIDPYDDPNPSELTNQQFIDWETERLSQKTQRETSLQNIQSSRDNFNLTLQEYEIIVDIEAEIAGAFYNELSPDIDTMFNALNNRLTGTSIRDGAIDYIQTVGGVANLQDNKAVAVNVGLQYLRILKGVYEAKNGT